MKKRIIRFPDCFPRIKYGVAMTVGWYRSLRGTKQSKENNKNYIKLTMPRIERNKMLNCFVVPPRKDDTTQPSLRLRGTKQVAIQK